MSETYEGLDGLRELEDTVRSQQRHVTALRNARNRMLLEKLNQEVSADALDAHLQAVKDASGQSWRWLRHFCEDYRARSYGQRKYLAPMPVVTALDARVAESRR